MPALAPVSLQDDYPSCSNPSNLYHAPDLEAAAADGELWNLWFTSAPAPGQAHAYIEKALDGLAANTMLPFAVREKSSGQIVGTTRFYDIVHRNCRAWPSAIPGMRNVGRKATSTPRASACC
jgi:RimJ/RimL family protein N-acetyltransferase